jgi:hypothetical protein
MNRSRNSSIPNTRARKKNPLEGVTGGWPSTALLERELQARAREAVPYIVLEGTWLRDCGFEIGRRYVITPGKGAVTVEADQSAAS